MAALLLATSAHAATLQISGRQLTGATGVDVGGVLYDVEFKAGGCTELFARCDAVSDFAFQTAAAAEAAAWALHAHVLGDGPQGQFDGNPALTRGCTGVCDIWTPYGLVGDPWPLVQVKATYNHIVDHYDGVYADAVSNAGVWAIWTRTPGAAVPLPSSLVLLAPALLGLATGRRRPNPAT